MNIQLLAKPNTQNPNRNQKENMNEWRKIIDRKKKTKALLVNHPMNNLHNPNSRLILLGQEKRDILTGSCLKN